MFSAARIKRLLGVLILLLVGWLLLAAAYVSSGRLLMPVLDRYQAELVERARELTGRHIELQRLQGQMQGSQPVLLLHGLKVHADADPQSPRLFDLQHVTARLDLFASLWQRQPVMDAVQIEGLSLALVEDAEGRWQLEGLGERPQQALGLPALLASQRRITLLDTRIRISPREQGSWQFEQGQLTLRQDHHQRRLDAQVQLPDGRTLSLQLSATAGTSGWLPDTGRLYLQLPDTDWQRWLPSLWVNEYGLDELRLPGQWWLDWDNGTVRRLQAELQQGVMRLGQREAQPAMQVQSLPLRLDYQRSGSSQSLQVEDFGFRLDDNHWPAGRLQLHWQDAESAWQLHAEHLALQPLARLLARLLPDQAGLLGQLAPEGYLQQLQVSGERGLDWQALQFSARLQDVGIAAWQGAPAMHGIDGVITGSPASGQLQLDARDWSLHLPRLFPEAWHYQHALGRFDWHWSPQQGFDLSTDGVRVEGEEGRIGVVLGLQLPPAPADPHMQLRVALHDSHARWHRRYLPTRSPAFLPAVDAWLVGAELDGRVPLGIFSYQGSLAADADPDARRFDLQLDVRDGQLRFQPDWPLLQQVNARLWLDDGVLDIAGSSARLWNTRLTDIRVDTRRSEPQQPLRLNIDGLLQGPLQDALQLMQDSPLAQLSGDPLQGWRGDGSVDGRLQLAVPLVSEAELAVQVDWRLEAEQLAIPLLQEPLQAVAATLRWSSDSGLSSSALDASFLDQPLQAALSTDSQGLLIELAARHSVAQLQRWPLLQQWPAQLAEGAADWQAQVRIGSTGSTLTVRSDLQGLALMLPGELGKTAEQSRQLLLQANLQAQRQLWELQLGDDQRARAQLDSRGLTADLRVASGQPQLGDQPGLTLSARLQQLDWDEWRDQFARLTRRESGQALALPVREASLQVADFNGFGRQLNTLDASLARVEGGWLLALEQQDIRGQILWPDSDRPARIDLQHFNLPRPAKHDPDSAIAKPLLPVDPLADVDPASLPELDLHIEELRWGGEAVGELRTRLRRSEQGMRLHDLDIDLRGLRLTGDLDWSGQGHSRFDGVLQADDIGQVLRAWKYTPTLTSDTFVTDARLQWPGSPAFFALSRSTGELRLQARNGMLQSGDGSAEALRVFGLLNFNALTRRLRLDFSDLFGKGTAYDTLGGKLRVEQGVLSTMEPLRLEGPSARLKLEGQLDLPQDNIDMGLLVTLPVTNNLPLAALIAGAPQLGGVLFIADRLFGERMSRFASVKYRVSGDWQQPTVEFDRAFDNKAALED